MMFHHVQKSKMVPLSTFLLLANNFCSFQPLVKTECILEILFDPEWKLSYLIILMLMYLTLTHVSVVINVSVNWDDEIFYFCYYLNEMWFYLL
jgi:hypothetical protein